jgi:hypothetical protein
MAWLTLGKSPPLLGPSYHSISTRNIIYFPSTEICHRDI